MNKHMKTFTYGLTIFVLIILSGIITGIVLIPISILDILLLGDFWLISIFGLITGIYFLGWVFQRFKVRMKGR